MRHARDGAGITGRGGAEAAGLARGRYREGDLGPGSRLGRQALIRPVRIAIDPHGDPPIRTVDGEQADRHEIELQVALRDVLERDERGILADQMAQATARIPVGSTLLLHDGRFEDRHSSKVAFAGDRLVMITVQPAGPTTGTASDRFRIHSTAPIGELEARP